MCIRDRKAGNRRGMEGGGVLCRYASATVLKQVCELVQVYNASGAVKNVGGAVQNFNGFVDNHGGTVRTQPSTHPNTADCCWAIRAKLAAPLSTRVHLSDALASRRSSTRRRHNLSGPTSRTDSRR
eukprot:2771537-Rhodomonas_salina.1